MDKSKQARALSEYEDMTGVIIKVKLYTPLCLCFPLSDTSSQTQIIQTLTQGLEQLSTSFPWLAAQVINDEKRGHLKMAPWGKVAPLIVKDFTSDISMPSMDDLRNSNFPSSLLDGEILTNLKGPPMHVGEDPAPVFMLQANFIRGGLLLCFAGEHSTMDGQGLGQLIRMFSQACHNIPPTNEEVEQGNRSHKNIIPLLDKETYKPSTELDFLVSKPGTKSLDLAADLPPSKWAYINFSKSSLQKIKSMATATPTSSSTSESISTAFISTNDALSAFLWKITSRIRSMRLPPTTPTFPNGITTTLGRAVDLRPVLSLPEVYLGNCSNHTYTTLPLHSLPSTPLPLLASTLRAALNPSHLLRGIQSLATYISLTPDEELYKVSYGANMDFTRDLFLSSWVKLPVYECEFNLGLGYPEAVRRLKFMGVEGLFYMMPMDRDGGIAVAICLNEMDLEGLREDGEMMEYGEWVG